MPFYVYITANQNNTVLYTGVTKDLKKRIAEHKLKVYSGFTKRYQVDKLVYYEVFEHAKDAISRAKQIKGGSRQKKVDLIRNVNRKYADLASRL
jgi:putative endonuclease